MSDEMRDRLREYSRRGDDTDDTVGIDWQLTEHIEWFLQNVWHDVSEDPKDGMPLLIIMLGDFEDFRKKVRIGSFNAERGSYVISSGYSRGFVEKWAYLEDLLLNGKSDIKNEVM